MDIHFSQVHIIPLFINKGLKTTLLSVYGCIMFSIFYQDFTELTKQEKLDKRKYTTQHNSNWYFSSNWLIVSKYIINASNIN